jgi:hypothetical protein
MNDEGTKFSCYSFETTWKKSWQDAKSACEGKNGHLIIIESRAENEFIKAVIPYASARWWIGATDFALPRWQWVDGSIMTFTDWYTGQPAGDDREDCLELWGNHGLRWNDAICSLQKYFVCEYEYAV